MKEQLHNEIVKSKDETIVCLTKALDELTVKYDQAVASLMLKTAESAEYKATAEARAEADREAKAMSESWHSLADTLRKDNKEFMSMWK